MKLVTGALFLLIAEQAYSHANMIEFPNHIKASEVLFPASLTALILGILLIVWGLWSESGRSGSSAPAGRTTSSDS